MAGYRTCVFCNRADSPPSREHVLAKWISAEFSGTTFWEMENIVTGERFKNKQIGLITRKPCKRCNTTWMAKLEAKAKQLLIPLMKGHSITLWPDHQKTIARWFTKTVIMHEMLDREPYYFDPHERYALETSLEVPTPSHFSMAWYRGKKPASTYATHLNLIIGEHTPSPVHVHGYAATFTIQQLALQLFSVRLPPEHPPDSVGFRMPGKLPEMSVQIWPVQTVLVEWPPRYFLDDRALGVFKDRWTSLR